MARKTISLRELQQAREQAAAGNKHPMPLTTAHYLAQLRPPVFKVPPKPRQQIAIQVEEPPQAPSVVKIIHTDSI